MKTRLAILGLLTAGILATAGSPTPPAAAGDYWIGSYAYAIEGATVRSSVWCQQNRRISIYELTATDTAEHRYWLLFEPAQIPDVIISHTGLVRIEGTDMIWIGHRLGAMASVATSIPGCWPRDEDPLEPRYARWLPWVVRG